MKKLAYFELIGKRGFYRPVGKVSFEQAVDMVAEAMKQARELQAQSLLVNVGGLTGFSSPSIFARHSMAVKWAESAGSRLHVAVVAPAELIDPQKIGVVMVQNRGVSGDVFTHESAAISWLDSRHANEV